MKRGLLISGLLTIACCSARQDNPSFDKKTEEPKTEDKEAILYERKILHNFSSTIDKDTFKIVATGRSILDGQIEFQIVNKGGTVILDEVFPATSFLNYGLNDSPTEKEKQEYIKSRIDKFLKEDNFRQPAINFGSNIDRILLFDWRRRWTTHCLFKEIQDRCSLL